MSTLCSWHVVTFLLIALLLPSLIIGGEEGKNESGFQVVGRHIVLKDGKGRAQKLSIPASSLTVPASNVGAGGATPRCTKAHIEAVKGWLLDLDGTMYGWNGLLPGVKEFFNWLETTKANYVLVSNGMKSADGVVKKFQKKDFALDKKIDPSKVYTTAMAFKQYLKEKVPRGARILTMGTTMNDVPSMLKDLVEPDLFSSWEVKSNLTMQETLQWAEDAKTKGRYTALVAAFGDGEPIPDYYFFSIASILLRNNVHFIVGGSDTSDVHPKNPLHPDVVLSYPWLGSYESFLVTAGELFPGSARGQKYHHNIAKGGSLGNTYMMGPSIAKLRTQDQQLKLEDIMMLGDNLGTDIRAAGDAQIKSLLVQSGVHSVQDVEPWRAYPTCYLDGVGDIPKLFAA